MDELTSEQLYKLAKKEKNAQHYKRLLAVAHFKNGMSRTAIAAQMKVSRTSVNKWVGQFLQGGLNALQPKPTGHRRPKLNEKQTKQLCKFIDESAQSDKGGRLIGLDIQAYIQEQFGVEYSPNHIYKILKKNLGIRR